MDRNLPNLRRSVLTIILLFSFAFCFAATYYIDPNGNDATGNGSMANPWKTLHKATQTVTSAGNTIHVNAGTYLETQECYLAVGVNIEGSGYTTSIIKGEMTGQFSTLLSLDSPEDTNGGQTVSNLTFDGQYVNETNYKTVIGVFVTGRSNVMVHDCKVINFKSRGVIFAGNNFAPPVFDPGHYATGNKFYNNTVLNSSENNGIYGSGLLNIGGQMGMEIYNNTMIQDQRPDFKNGWPLKPWNNGWVKGVKIHHNILTKAPYKGTFPGQNGDWDFCIEIFNIEGGVEIYNNTIQGSIDLNYSRKGAYAFSAWIHHNTLGPVIANPNVESGMLLEYRTESILIEYNVLNNLSLAVQFNTRTVNDDGGYPNPGGGTPPGGFSYLLNNTIRNNLFSNIYQGNGAGGAGGIAIASESGNDPQINGMNIYNNTIVAKSGDAPSVGLDFSSGENGNAININIRNNIVNGFGYCWLYGSSPTTAMTGVVVTHNDAFGNGNNVPIWPGGNPITYTYNNNLSVNPLFVSVTDFHLQVSSPVIDKGIDIGLAYSGNAPDMGYAEYGFGGPLPIILTDFKVNENNGKNLLQWTTATESNSGHFSIERSNDARHFEAIGRVNASGFSTAEIKYNFTDAVPPKGINYYRLAMVDKDGNTAYSKIISINNKDNYSIDIMYINLSAQNNTAFLKLNSSKTQTANLCIFDVSGRIILNSELSLQSGENTITKSLPPIANGIYYIRLTTADEKLVKNTFSRN